MVMFCEAHSRVPTHNANHATMASSDQLQEAIESATLERLRIVFLTIYSKSEETSKLAAEELLIQSSATKKRKSDGEHSTLRYEVCFHCEEEYHTTTNGPNSCQITMVRQQCS